MFRMPKEYQETVVCPLFSNGTQYALDNLTENARAQIVNLRVTDQEIARLQTQLAIAQTARAAYAQALTAQLPAAADAKQAK